MHGTQACRAVGVVFLGAAWGAVARQDLPFSMPVASRSAGGHRTAGAGDPAGSIGVDPLPSVIVSESGSGNLATPDFGSNTGSGVSFRRPG
jgi:hypothetical protein